MKLSILPFLIGIIACGSKDCRTLKAEFSGQVSMNKNALVLIEGGIVGYVEDVSFKAGVTHVELCLQDTTSISRNSTVEAGFVNMYGARCILIRPGDDSQVLANEEKLKGINKDTLEINYPSQTESDNALKKRALEILKEQNRRDSLEGQ